MRRALCFVLGAAALVGTTVLTAQTPTPQSVASELLAADRAFSKSGASLPAIDAIAAMLVEDVVAPVPPGVFADGKAKVVAALGGNPDNKTGRVEWTPLRAGVSADGLHGFTYGFMTLTRADKTSVPLKYMAYWIKGAEGWRVVAYKRRQRGAGDVPTTPMPSIVPDRLVAPVTDAAVIAKHRDSLAAAEKSFSDEAQKIGIGAAFEKFGSPDAANMGGPADATFTMGNVAIGQAVGGGAPASGSPVSWAADHKTIVASSGDLGITFGFIRPNAPGPDGKTPPPQPFYTIWRRASPTAPWRYVAE